MSMRPWHLICLRSCHGQQELEKWVVACESIMLAESRRDGSPQFDRHKIVVDFIVPSALLHSSSTQHYPTQYFEVFCGVLTLQVIPDKVPNIFRCLRWSSRFLSVFPKRAAEPRSGRSPSLG